MGDILGPLVMAAFGGKMFASLGTMLQRELVERLIGNLTDYVTPTTTISMVDSLPEAAAEAIRDAVVTRCTDEITREVRLLGTLSSLSSLSSLLIHA